MSVATMSFEDRLRAFADRGSRSGPIMRTLVDDLDNVKACCESLAEQLEELASACDEYENADEGRDGADDRASAWEQAQDAAGEAANSLAELIGELS